VRQNLRMLRLRNRFQLSARIRDRLGMLCAVGAVACLGSLIVHRSQPYPVQRSAWEQEIFSDLADRGQANVEASASPGETKTAASSISAHPTSSNTGDPHLITRNPVDHLSIENSIPRPLKSLLAAPIDRRPAGERPRFILPVRHEQTSVGESVWLSGEIEIPVEQPSRNAEEPVTLFFLPLEPE
jgi:hypothetical protein